MTAVIIGPMQPHAIDALLASLHDATRLPTWRCPNLLFMLPPSAVWIANKIHAIVWPARLHLHVIDEPMISASSVWNALLGIWTLVKERPVWEPVTPPDYPIKVAELSAIAKPAPVAVPAEGAPVARSRPPLDPGPRPPCPHRHAAARGPARLRGDRRDHRPGDRARVA